MLPPYSPHNRGASQAGVRDSRVSAGRPDELSNKGVTNKSRDFGARIFFRFYTQPRRSAVLLVLIGFVIGALASPGLYRLLKGNTNEQAAVVVVSSAVDDAPFLGSQTSFSPPARLPSFTFKASPYQAVYDRTWTDGSYPKDSCWGCRFGPAVVARLPFHSVLDAGCGNGALVRLLRRHGKSAFGIELSSSVLERECPDLLQQGLVEPGSLTNLPYADSAFDLVFSADVLEHILPEEADAAVAELVRVTRRHIVLSISLKGHTRASAADGAEAHRHTLLRPRAWWERIFRRHGAVPNAELVWALQDRDLTVGGQGLGGRGGLSDCRWEGADEDGGRFEVCVADLPWLVGAAEQGNLRRERCVTPSNGELEPWLFAFRKLR